MAELNLDIAAEVAAACRAGAEELAAALGRAFGGAYTVAVDAAGSSPTAGGAAALAGPGLALLLRIGDAGLAAVLPESTGLLPPWCRQPDATGENRLATLAQELGMLVVPESVAASGAGARYVADLGVALARAGLGSDAATVSLSIAGDDRTGEMLLVWPLAQPERMFESVAATAEAPTQPAEVKPAAGSTASANEPGSRPLAGHRPRVRQLSDLPGYARSLLKIRVPVSVQLAAKKELVHEVIALAPGSIIKFDKGCDESLEMIVGEHTIAEGEAVKIGEKFGFRVTSMLLPREHFVPAKRKGA
ncbi:MAG: hypothetical protein DCC67_16570 [Planctomycetota bacterium]|nr:MAG: hypothetical protein DCC67_16570 [Planctomycetota bacterium]